MTAPLWTLTAAESRRRIAAGEITAQELLSAHLERIDAVEPRVHAFLARSAEAARRDAEAVDGSRARGELAPLAGAVLGVKDVIAGLDHPTTAASRILEGYVSPYEATSLRRARARGAVVVGKTNLDEFAMGSSSEHSAFGPTLNPWDLERVPGGSSSGSAAAVAAGMAQVALGTDTGGSIRQPASFCGTFGLKPTYGRVSRYGVVAFASSMDQVGPLGRSVEDVARLFEAIAGGDELDASSAAEPVEPWTGSDDVRGLAFAVPDEYVGAGVDPGVARVVREAARALLDAGAVERRVALPATEHALDAYYLVADAEASSNLGRYDGLRYGPRRAVDAPEAAAWISAYRGRSFGTEVKRRIMLGTHVLSAGYYDAYYLRAMRVRALIRRELLAALETVDFLLTPTSPVVAFRLGERVDDPLAMYAVDILSVTANLAGLPAMSVPAGLHQGLPVGVQLMGRPFQETLLFRAAEALSRRLPQPAAWEAGAVR